MTVSMFPLPEPFEVTWKDGDVSLKGIAIAAAYSPDFDVDSDPYTSCKKIVDHMTLIVRREGGYLESVHCDEIAMT